jgi:quinol monooxygenase YgiN
MLQLNLRLRSRPQKASEVIRALRSIVIATQAESGFLGSRIYQDAADPENLCLEADWSSEPMFRSYIRSTCFTDLLMLMEIAPQAPVLKIHFVDEIRGFEYVEEVRFGRT